MTTSIDPAVIRLTGSSLCGSMANWGQGAERLYLAAVFGESGTIFSEPPGQYVGYLEGVMD